MTSSYPQHLDHAGEAWVGDDPDLEMEPDDRLPASLNAQQEHAVAIHDFFQEFMCTPSCARYTLALFAEFAHEIVRLLAKQTGRTPPPTSFATALYEAASDLAYFIESQKS